MYSGLKTSLEAETTSSLETSNRTPFAAAADGINLDVEIILGERAGEVGMLKGEVLKEASVHDESICESSDPELDEEDSDSESTFTNKSGIGSTRSKQGSKSEEEFTKLTLTRPFVGVDEMTENDQEKVVSNETVTAESETSAFKQSEVEAIIAQARRDALAFSKSIAMSHLLTAKVQKFVEKQDKGDATAAANTSRDGVDNASGNGAIGATFVDKEAQGEPSKDEDNSHNDSELGSDDGLRTEATFTDESAFVFLRPVEACRAKEASMKAERAGLEKVAHAAGEALLAEEARLSKEALAEENRHGQEATRLEEEACLAEKEAEKNRLEELRQAQLEEEAKLVELRRAWLVEACRAKEASMKAERAGLEKVAHAAGEALLAEEARLSKEALAEENRHGQETTRLEEEACLAEKEAEKKPLEELRQAHRAWLVEACLAKEVSMKAERVRLAKEMQPAKDALLSEEGHLKEVAMKVEEVHHAEEARATESPQFAEGCLAAETRIAKDAVRGVYHRAQLAENEKLEEPHQVCLAEETLLAEEAATKIKQATAESHPVGGTRLEEEAILVKQPSLKIHIPRHFDMNNADALKHLLASVQLKDKDESTGTSTEICETRSKPGSAFSLSCGEESAVTKHRHERKHVDKYMHNQIVAEGNQEPQCMEAETRQSIMSGGSQSTDDFDSSAPSGTSSESDSDVNTVSSGVNDPSSWTQSTEPPEVSVVEGSSDGDATVPDLVQDFAMRHEFKPTDVKIFSTPSRNTESHDSERSSSDSTKLEAWNSKDDLVLESILGIPDQIFLTASSSEKAAVTATNILSDDEHQEANSQDRVEAGDSTMLPLPPAPPVRKVSMPAPEQIRYPSRQSVRSQRSAQFRRVGPPCTNISHPGTLCTGPSQALNQRSGSPQPRDLFSHQQIPRQGSRDAHQGGHITSATSRETGPPSVVQVHPQSDEISSLSFVGISQVRTDALEALHKIMECMLQVKAEAKDKTGKKPPLVNLTENRIRLQELVEQLTIKAENERAKENTVSIA
eukprot:CAMPEP_0197467898 /NCGR_PEP_ID=MMETSP1175-20131217/65806_1 /TAXON_ID=1003142 /ORGANISM="Triceratium dubium, Strain CCMP147" /LENGTH=1023 /DNA_ID=CAMNT_0043003989 /DNA_START=27 /DNA_END=3100 /DNA_ORIENTATION=-